MKKTLIFLFTLFFLMPIGFTEAKETAEQLIIVNKKVNQLAFYEEGVLEKKLPVATGRTKTLTPEGVFKVTVKWKCPIYYKTKKQGCDPTNPLGPRWLGLNVPGTSGYTYGIHGNNNPSSIGTNASSGCIRLHNEDIKWLFDRIKEGAVVIIVDSNLSFEEIAKQHKIELAGKAEKINKMVTIFEPTVLYKEAKKSAKTTETISGKFHATEQLASWIAIETNEGKKWVKKDDTVLGTEQAVEKIVFLPKEANVYRYPGVFVPILTKETNKNVQVIAEFDHWVKVFTPFGERWFNQEDLITSPHLTKAKRGYPLITSWLSKPWLFK